LSWALPQAFGYSGCSVALRLSPCRQSHRLAFPLVRLEVPRSLGSPIPSGSRSVVSALRRGELRRDRSVCPIVPCVAEAVVGSRPTQLGFGQASPYHGRRGFPTRLRYLTRLAFLMSCSGPLPPFGARSDAALTTLTPVACTPAASGNAPQWRTPSKPAHLSRHLPQDGENDHFHIDAKRVSGRSDATFLICPRVA